MSLAYSQQASAASGSRCCEHVRERRGVETFVEVFGIVFRHTTPKILPEWPKQVFDSTPSRANKVEAFNVACVDYHGS